MSSITESQIIAFLITWAPLLLLGLLGRLAKVVPSGGLRDVITFVSFDARLAPFARGPDHHS